jgi:hypothetical protein
MGFVISRRQGTAASPELLTPVCTHKLTKLIAANRNEFTVVISWIGNIFLLNWMCIQDRPCLFLCKHI